MGWEFRLIFGVLVFSMSPINPQILRLLFEKLFFSICQQWGMVMVTCKCKHLKKSNNEIAFRIWKYNNKWCRRWFVIHLFANCTMEEHFVLWCCSEAKHFVTFLCQSAHDDGWLQTQMTWQKYFCNLTQILFFDLSSYRP